MRRPLLFLSAANTPDRASLDSLAPPLVNGLLKAPQGPSYRAITGARGIPAWPPNPAQVPAV